MDSDRNITDARTNREVINLVSKKEATPAMCSEDRIPADLMTRVIPAVVIIDEDESTRKSLLRLLSAANHTCFSYGSVAQFLASELRHATGCVLLDLHLPSQENTKLETVLTWIGKSIPVICLSDMPEVRESVKAIKAGAWDFLVKPVTKEELFPAVEQALAQYLKEQEEHFQSQQLKLSYDSLTPREREVLLLVISGLRNKQIGNQLGTTERTVKAHRSNIMEKLGLR